MNAKFKSPAKKFTVNIFAQMKLLTDAIIHIFAIIKPSEVKTLHPCQETYIQLDWAEPIFLTPDLPNNSAK